MSMIQTNQVNQQSEAPHFKVIDLFKRLVYKDDVTQYYYNENQHLKMLLGQKTACTHPIGQIIFLNLACR